VVAHVVDDENVGVVQRTGGARLLLESPEPIRIIRDRGGQDLDRHVAPEPCIPGAIHLAHSALADGRGDLVWAESCTGRQGHGGLL
jgi:hypothetical protein